MQIFCLFCKKNLLFSILHTHFYKTPTSVCLFYHLFYLNNHFPHFFLIFYLKLSLSTHKTLSIPTETLLSKTPLHHIHSPIQALILTEPQASIYKRWSTLSISIICQCMGVFDFVVFVVEFVVDFMVDFLFLWLIFDFVSMGVCVLEEERRWWGRECVSFADGEEREKKRSKIRNY